MDIDVLIVGGGPSGLMMACQLKRRGINIRIIDKQAGRAHESRAFGVQAKTMEIFQNLGIAEKFLTAAKARSQGIFFVNGKQRAIADLGVLENFGTPYPQLYFIPQNVTEKILEEHLNALGVTVERETELKRFSDMGTDVACDITHLPSGKSETINCKYIIGCDGAHSFVRTQLGLPFDGDPYEQQFVLADAVVNWPYGREDFMFFFSPKGMLIHARIDGTKSRLMGARFNDTPGENPPPVSEIEQLARDVTGQKVTLDDCQWRSRFHLYHRAVKEYSKGRAFLAGDSAHIHTPVGAQGMNTGLQDTTNLAWKLAWVVKGAAPESLLATYHGERKRIGTILLASTDRMFGIMTAKGPLATPLRNFFIPFIFPIIFKIDCLRRRLFRFMSQLAIKYHPSAFVWEGADALKNGPKAGMRAPDGSLETGSLFEAMKGPEAHVLLFGLPVPTELQTTYESYVRFHSVMRSTRTENLFKLYGMETGIYFIRPDGYVGLRYQGSKTEVLKDYLEALLSGCR
jgi:2-polyprenyl-6-methoxyphenol hydroxylase-like FAD-dependent oxidoreductase